MKSLEIKRILEKNKLLEEQKINDYYKKQAHLQKQKIIIDSLGEEEKRKKQMMNETREQKIKKGFISK